jgi:hypothetical protein
MAHIPQLMWWEVLGDHKTVEVPLVLVRALEVMVLKEKSKRNLPLLMWYEEFNFILMYFGLSLYKIWNTEP